MKKKLLILTGMLAVLLTAAVPVLAQGQVTATGVLERSTRESEDPEPLYAITDEETGTSYELISGFVDLEQYVDQRVLVYGVPVPGLPAPEGGPRALNVTEVVPLGSSGEVATVTFELTIDGEVPEGQTLALRLGGGSPSRFYEGPAGDAVFCATDGNPNLPACEDGGIYSDTLQVPVGQPIAFDYVRLGDGGEVFFSDERTFTEDATVRATYTAPADDGEEDPNSPSTGSGGSDSGGSSDASDPANPETGEDINEDGSIDEADGEVAASVSDAAREDAEATGERTLPVTGGVRLLPLFAGPTGLLLTIGVLLIHRAAR